MNRSSSSRLTHLVDLMRQNNISRIQMAELEELLQDDAHMEEYVNLMAMDSMLHASFANEGAHSLDHLFPVTPAPTPEPLPGPYSGKWFWGSIAAAVVLGGLGFWALTQMALREKNPEDPNISIAASSDDEATVSDHATITNWIGLTASDQKRYSSNYDLHKGYLTLTSGLLEITTPNQSRLIVEAPARFRMQEPNQVDLGYGKIAVKSRNKFQSVIINYADQYYIRGGESFAISLPKETPDTPEVSSLRGNIRVRSHASDETMLIAEYESMRFHNREATTVPFKGDSFMWHIPVLHDITWISNYDRGEKIQWVKPNDPNYIKNISFTDKNGYNLNQTYGLTKAKTLTINVNDLVWAPGNYRAVLKWIRGADAMIIENIQLYHHDKLISEDIHIGKTGTHSNTLDHIYHLKIPKEDFKRGGWTVRAKVRGIMKSNGTLPQQTEGVLHFGHQESFAAQPKDFIGSWEYRHNGSTYVRKVYPNGMLTLYSNGVQTGINGQWKVVDDILHVRFNNSSRITERHILRDKQTLLFIDQPYNNAVQIGQ